LTTAGPKLAGRQRASRSTDRDPSISGSVFAFRTDIAARCTNAAMRQPLLVLLDELGLLLRHARPAQGTVGVGEHEARPIHVE
jgi:hypothetical protein